MREVVQACAQHNIHWRIDPVFQFIAATGSAAKKILSEIGCSDATAEVRRLARRKTGVRIVACERFAGMLVYSFEDRMLYHVDADTFTAAPVLDYAMAAHFKGLGKASAYKIPNDFNTLSEAILAFQGHARRAQLKWLDEKGHPAARRTRTRTKTPARPGRASRTTHRS